MLIMNELKCEFVLEVSRVDFIHVHKNTFEKLIAKFWRKIFYHLLILTKQAEPVRLKRVNKSGF